MINTEKKDFEKEEAMEAQASEIYLIFLEEVAEEVVNNKREKLSQLFTN